MAPVALDRFARTLAGAERVAVDTAVLIYQLENITPYVQLTSYLLAHAGAGITFLIVSTITVGELLVGPWRSRGRQEARRIEDALRALPGLLVADITWDVAAQGAALRARTNLPFPDALILASAIEHGAQVVVTNDAAWRVKSLPCRVVVLDDYI